MRATHTGAAAGLMSQPGRSPRPMLHTHSTTRMPSGTIVLTLEGEMPVEFLSAGDRIITRNTGTARLTGIRQWSETQQAVRFAPGSLGDTRPDCALILPADQRLLIRDWRAKALFGTPQAVVEARALIDGEFIRDLGAQDLQLTELQFDRPRVVYAGGLELATTDSPARAAA